MEQSILDLEYLDPPMEIGLATSVPPLFPSTALPNSLSTAEKVLRAKAAIIEIYAAGRPTCLAYSGGKDSSVMLSLALTAAVEFKKAGGKLPQILVTHANTGIENPAYQVVIHHEIDRIQKFSREHDLPLRVDIATPTLNDSWSVRIISGRALPTFANSSTRDCSVSWKIKPQERQRKIALRDLGADGSPVVLVGTRFDESTSRAERMRDRGESDVDIWQQEVRDKNGRLQRIEHRMSPVAWWSDEDIWVYMSQLGTGDIHSYTDGQEVWEAYADGGGGGGCAVVGDEGMKANAKACGARFGCSLCTAVGRDKSLESMIESDAKYAYMKGLNRLQRFLVDTQNNWNLRQWVGRSIDDDGFIAILPDAYSPGMASFLLAAALTIDIEEREAAYELDIAPRFQLVSAQQLIAIDAIWSLQAFQRRPFAAIKVWDEVVNKGKRYHPPEVVKKYTDKQPPARYLWVGNWDDPHPHALPAFGGGGIIDPVAMAAGVGERRDQAIESVRLSLLERRANGERITQKEEAATYEQALANAGGCIGTRTLEDGRMVIDVRAADMFDIDEEAASLFLQFEAQRKLQHDHDDPLRPPTAAYKYYAQTGIVGTTPQHLSTADEMMRRANWKIRHGLHKLSRDEVLAWSISKAERTAGLLAPEGKPTLHEIYLQSPFVQRERKYFEINQRWAERDAEIEPQRERMTG